MQPLPWYMSNGERLPQPAQIGPNGRRIAKLWPLEDRGADRIENQLMFSPPEVADLEKIKKVFRERFF